MFSFFKNQKTNPWLETPAANAAHKIIDEYYKDSLLGAFSSKYKDDLRSGVIQEIIKIRNDRRPELRLRTELFAQVLMAARYSVLALKESELDELPAWKAEPGISGELHHHIVQLRRELDWFYEDTAKYTNDECTYDNLIDVCNHRTVRAKLFINCYNVIRVREYKDYVPEHDWLQPLLTHSCVCFEEEARTAIGLPSVITDPLGVIPYFTIGNLVRDGHPDPVGEFEKIRNLEIEDEEKKYLTA